MTQNPDRQYVGPERRQVPMRGWDIVWGFVIRRQTLVSIVVSIFVFLALLAFAYNRLSDQISHDVHEHGCNANHAFITLFESHGLRYVPPEGSPTDCNLNDRKVNRIGHPPITPEQQKAVLLMLCDLTRKEQTPVPAACP